MTSTIGADVLFIYPPYERPVRRGGVYYSAPPLGVLYLSQNLKNHGFIVDALDMNVCEAGADEVAEMISELRPRVCAINCSSPAAPLVRKIIQKTRGRGVTSTIFAVGGPHVTADPESSTLLDADSLFQGEADTVFADYVEKTLKKGDNSSVESGKEDAGAADSVKGDAGSSDSVKDNGPGDSVKDNVKGEGASADSVKDNVKGEGASADSVNENVNCGGKVSTTPVNAFTVDGGTQQVFDCGLVPDLSLLGFPDRSLFDMRKYAYVPFETSRGCPYSCIYCNMACTGHRLRPVEDIRGEAEQLVESGVHAVDVVDDCFGADKKHSLEVAKIFRENQISFNISTRADLADAEWIKELRKSGLAHVNFGVEAGTHDRRRELGKDIGDRFFKDAFMLCRDLGVKTTASAVFGGPGETKDSVEKTFDFIKCLEPDDLMYSALIPYPNTKAFKLGVSEGVFEGDCWKKYVMGESEMPAYLPSDMNAVEVDEAIFEAMKDHYLTAKNTLSRMGSSKSVGEFLGNTLAFGIFIKRKIIKKR